MPYRTMSRALKFRPINSQKHVVDIQAGVIGTAVSIVDLVNTVDAPVSTTSNNVRTGSVVSSIYLKVEATTSITVSSGTPSIYFYVMKNPGNDLTTKPQPDAVGINDLRKFVIHQEMTMLAFNSADAFPRTMFQGVIKIPAKYKRFGQNDKLQLVVGWSGNVDASASAAYCSQCIYKEFF